MATENYAAWLTGPRVKPFKVDVAPMPIAGPTEVVIKTHAAAANPVDWMIQHLGILVPEDAYPTILGTDVAGEIVSIGSDVKNFAVGDRVVALVGGSIGFAMGSFMLYCKGKTPLIAKLPDHVPYKDACVLPLGICTAATALFQKDALALPHPKVNPVKTGKVLLIWGGSSSVGSCAIQVAVAAGFEVATTASAHNHDYCKALGAKWVFDYKKDGVDDEIVEALKGRETPGVLDAWCRGTLRRCAHIVLRLEGRKWLQTVLPKNAPLAEEIPDGIEIGYTWGSSLATNEVGPAVWEDWIPYALADGTLKCKPDANVVGKGLEAAQTACDIGLKGENSASKLVIEVI